MSGEGEMEEVPTTVLCGERCHLGEGPTYDAATDTAWWFDIVEGLPDPLVVNSQIEVWDRPGMGVELIPDKAEKYLLPEDAGFFD